MSLTMASPGIRVYVGEPCSIFVLSSVLVGLSGDPVPWDRWLEVLSSDNIYYEEDFEWIVAGLLPCPLSMFSLHYNKTGVLQVIFAPRWRSMEHYRLFEFSCMMKVHPIFSVSNGLCNLCYSPVSRQYRSGLQHQDVQYLALTDDIELYLLNRCSGGWAENPTCHKCRETKVYLHNSVIKEYCAVDLNPYGQVWLDWILRFYDAAEQYTSPSLTLNLDLYAVGQVGSHDSYYEAGMHLLRRTSEPI